MYCLSSIFSKKLSMLHHSNSNGGMNMKGKETCFKLHIADCQNTIISICMYWLLFFDAAAAAAGGGGAATAAGGAKKAQPQMKQPVASSKALRVSSGGTTTSAQCCNNVLFLCVHATAKDKPTDNKGGCE